jgi:hypothetical protein
MRRPHPFTVTRGLVAEATRPTATAKAGHRELERSVIATILNGYEVGNPFGKRASRADFVVLSASIDQEVADAVRASVRRTFHTHEITIAAFAPTAFAVFRALYPHQKDLIILDVSGSATDAVFVKRGILSGVTSVPRGTDALIEASRDAAHAARAEHSGSFETRIAAAEQEWLAGLREVFATFAAEQALPRTLFLLADDSSRDFLKRILEGSDLRSLWLSGEPVSVLPGTPGMLASRVDVRGQAAGDFYLGLLALYSANTAGTALPADDPEPVKGAQC